MKPPVATPFAESLLPKRGSLVGECVRVMKARISAGDWSGYLPGERHLAESLNVGRDTIRLALGELTAAGVIEPGCSGRHRRIATEPGRLQAGERAIWRIGMLSPLRLEDLPHNMLAEVAQIRSLLALSGGTLEVLTPAWYDAARPEKKARALLQAEPRDGWILYRASPAVQAAFQAHGAPCVIRGHPHEGVALPYLDTDWAAVGRHAVGELWRMGHRRICLIMPRDGIRGNLATLQGARSFGEQDVEVGELRDDGTKEGLATALAGVMANGSRPTAFITPRPDQTVTLVTWLASRGLAVPRDCAVIALSSEPLLDRFVPAITAYRIDPQVFARRMVRHLEWLAEGRSGAKVGSLLMPELARGGSVARIGAVRSPA
jgi:LacI family transcriptional regulator